MEPLPWLFENGGLVWRAALAALPGAGVLAAALAPRVHARRQAKRARAAFGEPLASLAKLNDGARVTLTGTIEIEGEAARRFEDGAEAAAASVAYDPIGGAREPERWVTGQNVRAARLWLVVGSDRVELSGPVEVTAGSREVRLRKALEAMSAGARDRVASAFKNSRPHFSEKVVLFRSLSAGDRARVSGVLRKEAAPGEAGYRAAAVRWTLVPDGDQTSPTAERGLKAAFEGNPIVKGPGARSIALGAMAGALGFAAIFGLGGEIAASSASSDLAAFASEHAWAREVAFEVGDQIKPSEHPELPNSTGRTATALAAATPLHRAAALERYAEALDRRRDADPSLVDLRASLRRGHDACSAAALLGSHGRLEDAAALASRCDPETAAKALFLLGDFAGASGAIDRAGEAVRDPAVFRLGARAHLLAGKPALAAKELRRLAASLDASAVKESPSPDEVRSKERRAPAVQARFAEAIADALDARGGDAAAQKRLEGDPPRTLERSMLLADLEPPAARRARLEKVLKDMDAADSDAPRAWIKILLAEASDDGGAPPSHPWVFGPMLLLVNPLTALTPTLPSVEAAALAALAKQADPSERARRERARYAIAMAGFEIIAGQLERASAFIKAAGADLARLAEIDRDKLREAGFDVSSEDVGTPDLEQEKQHLRALEVALAFAAGKPEEARRLAVGPSGRHTPLEHVDVLLNFRGQGDTTGLKVALQQSWDLVQEGEWVRWALMARGDGAAVAAWLSRSDMDMGSFLPLGAPLIREGKDDLRAWLRHGYRPMKWFAGLGELLVDSVWVKQTAEALSDAELAARAGERAARFREALLRRDIAVPLALIERL